MNSQAERHLTKAEGYLAKGDGWYEKAADEIIAARAADNTLSYQEIGDRFGRSRKWANTLVTWRTTGSPGAPPFAEGAAKTARNEVGSFKKLLREAPMEQIEQTIAELPKERQQAIGAAAKESYLAARQDLDERERRMTPAEHKEREEGRRVVRDMTDGIINTFSPMTIINHLEAAGEELSAATERGGLTYEQMHQIDEADARWRSVLAFAKEMANE